MTCKYQSYGCKIQSENIEEHESQCGYFHAAENERLKKLQKDKLSFGEDLWDKFPERKTKPSF
jgi:hypothetical protein